MQLTDAWFRPPGGVRDIFVGFAAARAALAGLSALCLLAAMALPLRPAHACLRPPPPPALQGYPEDGSVDVPTDVILIYGSLAEAAALQLTSEAGKPIAFSQRKSHIDHFELVPQAPLEPRSKHTLRGRWPKAPGMPSEVELSISFTTGDGPLRQRPSPPAATMQHYTLVDAALDSCDVQRSGTCVTNPGSTLVEHLYLDLVNPTAALEGVPGSPRASLHSQSLLTTNLSGINQGTPYKCVRLRTRAANATYSDPIVLCGEDALLYRLEGSAQVTCSADGLRHEGKPVTGGTTLPPPAAASPAPTPGPSPGCSSSGLGSENRALPWPWALLCLGVLARRRRAGKRRHAAGSVFSVL